eukprot:tig00000144_g9076.t1
MVATAFVAPAPLHPAAAAPRSCFAHSTRSPAAAAGRKSGVCRSYSLQIALQPDVTRTTRTTARCPSGSQRRGTFVGLRLQGAAHPVPAWSHGSSARGPLCQANDGEGAPDEGDLDNAMPAIPNSLSHIAQLNQAMQEAAEREDFETAAKLRDEILALEGASLLVAEPERELASLSPSSIIQKCINMLKTGKTTDRCFACDQLGEVGVGEKALEALAEALHDSSVDVRNRAERAFWLVVHRYGMAEVDARLQDGITAMREGRLEDGVRIFGEVIRLAPDFAEAYNKRATCLYLLKRFDASLADCEKVVELQPKHFGALSGMGLCRIGQDDYEGALQAFTRAVAVNPNMLQVKQYIAAVRVKLQKRDRERGQ